MTQPNSDTPDIRSLILTIFAEAKALLKIELRMAQRELSENAARAGFGLALIFVAAFLAFIGLMLLAFAAVLGLAAAGIPYHWAALSVAVGFILIAGLCALVGKSRISATSLKPTRTLAQVKTDIKTVKEMARV